MLANILIVDDHPSQIDGYKSILEFNTSNLDVEFTTCSNCEQAYRLITDPINRDRFQFLFLDFSLPEYPEKNIFNGEDLGILARKHWPNTKILMLTSHSEAFILYDILQKLQPEGFLVKSDFSAEDLIEAFDVVQNGKNYYTVSVIQAKKLVFKENKFLDQLDRKIISLLSKGYQTKNLPKQLNLSLSAIEKRKASIKDYLGLAQASDQDIIQTARRLGLI